MNKQHIISDQSSTEACSSGDFDLRRFFPYLVRIYYRAVSQSVTGVYGLTHNLTVSEWRTMAVLGADKALSATEIIEHSSMDKVNVSRAVKGLEKSGFLKRDIDKQDRRRAVLQLTESGVAAFLDLIPKVTALERRLLDGLDQGERETLVRLMEKVRKNAENT